MYEINLTPANSIFYIIRNIPDLLYKMEKLLYLFNNIIYIYLFCGK